MIDGYKNNRKTGKRVMSDEDDEIDDGIIDITRRDLNRDDPKNKGLFKNISFQKHSLFSCSLSLSLHSPIHLPFFHRLDESPSAPLIIDEHSNDHHDVQNFTGNNLCIIY